MHLFERVGIEQTSQELARQIEVWIPGSRARLSKRDPGWIVKTPGDRKSAIVVRVIEHAPEKIELQWSLFGIGGSASFDLSDTAEKSRALAAMHRATSGEKIARIVHLTPAQRKMLQRLESRGFSMEVFTEEQRAFLERLGDGSAFRRLTKKLATKGVRDPKALAAYIGRKKHGKKKFQDMAAKGRRRRA